MLQVKLEDGTTLKLPKPEGTEIQQLGIRSLYLNQRIEDLDVDDALVLIDDIVYLILDFWKSKAVEKPFDRLVCLVEEDKLAFDNDRYKQLFHTRVRTDAELVETYKTGEGEEKARAKEKLKERGFIGKRVIRPHTKSFLLEAGIHI